MFESIALLIFPACVITAAIYDTSTMTIPNWLSLIILVSFCVVAPFAGFGLAELGASIGLGLGVLVIGFGLFAGGFLGGGDAKLIAASALWIGLPSILPYLLMITIAGGALALLILMIRRFPLPVFAMKYDWISRLHSSKEGIPYGIAIAAAALFIFPETDLFNGLIK